MALDRSITYPVGTTPPSAAYPEGEALNSTAPGALDGHPWEKEGINDWLGFYQALLRAGGVAASGTPDTALASQYMQMTVELASGRAHTYDDTGAVNAYILTAQTNQQTIQNLFDGMLAGFLPGITNAGASTANVANTGIKNIDETAAGGELVAGRFTVLRYRLATDDYEIVNALATTTQAGIVELADNAETQTGTDATRAVTPAGLESKVSSTTVKGIVELATNAETQAGVDAVRGVTPAGLESKTATETRKGIAEIATQAEADAGTDDTRMITPLKLANTPAAAASVGQAELKTSEGSVSVGAPSAALLVLPGGAYGFYPRTEVTYVGGVATTREAKIYSSTVDANDAKATHIYLNVNATGVSTLIAYQTYIQASPPYFDADGNLIGRYIFAEINKNTRAVASVYNAQEAPWHYNGPTDIRGKRMADGKKYRQRRDMSSVTFTHAQAKADVGKLREYHAAFADAPTVLEEITQVIKDADMHLIPRPMEPTADTVVVMLDPVSDLNHRLCEMCAHDEFDLNELLHSGMITIDSTPLARPGPPGVDVVGFNWK